MESIKLYKNSQLTGRRSYSAPIWEFSYEEKKFTLKNPLKIDVEIEEGNYTVENDELGIYANNENSFLEAYHEFLEHLVYYYNFYKDLSDEEIVGKAVTLKAIYSELIEENEL